MWLPGWSLPTPDLPAAVRPPIASSQMTTATVLTVAAAAGFASGSLPFGYLAGKMRGIDIRQHGSGNIGATNVIRVLGKGIGIPVFILDLLKGLLPCLFVRQWTGGLASRQPSPPWRSSLRDSAVSLVMCLPLGSSSRAAKVSPPPPVFCWASRPLRWVPRFSCGWRFSSPPGMSRWPPSQPPSLCRWHWRCRCQRNHLWDGPLLGFGILIAILVVLRHRANISRLIAGKEPKSGGRKSPTPAAPPEA